MSICAPEKIMIEVWNFKILKDTNLFHSIYNSIHVIGNYSIAFLPLCLKIFLKKFNTMSNVDDLVRNCNLYAIVMTLYKSYAMKVIFKFLYLLVSKYNIVFEDCDILSMYKIFSLSPSFYLFFLFLLWL